MKKIIFAGAVVSALVMANIPVAKAVDTIFWGTTASFKAYASDGTTLLPGSQTTGAAGLVELLYLGADGIYNGFSGTGTGVMGDDAVVQTSWIGSVSMGASGQFGATAAVSYGIGSKYSIMFFDTISPNYGAGTVPASGNYGMSGVFTQAGDPSLGGSDSFSFTQNYSATSPVAVPEPSTVALMLAGLGILGLRKMRRS